MVDDGMHHAPSALRRWPVVGGLFLLFFLLGLVSLSTFLFYLIPFVTLLTFISISILVLILAFSPAFSLSLGLPFVFGKSSASGAIDNALDSLSESYS
jgi:hypothetical protein